MISTKQAAVAAVVAAAGSAFAGTVDLNYLGVSGGTSAAKLRVSGVTYYAGHMTHMYTSGARSGQTFNTFCIDIEEAATPGSATYQIIDLADAPIPGVAFGQAKADAVSAVIANAIAMGWIDNRLQGDTGHSDYLGRMGAIQAAIWEALGFGVNIGASQTSNSLAVAYGQLMNENSFDSSLRTAGLRAIAAPGQQDMLYIIPLPPAAFAGLGMLVACFGVRAMRRR
ncbi:MAG: hypothetical protein LAT64_04580 [Phycisphaerales bacterium]|nr:hypothetical protein [Planctomycetota bacterium]MCH8508029.1 hypothetical protein [Phycisphaerales bacterium]